MKFTNNPPRIAIADARGNPTPEFYRWMASVTRMTGAVDGPFESAQFLTLSVTADLGAERVFSPVAGQLTGTDGGPGSTYTLGLANTAVAANTYGGLAKSVSFTVDAKGRLTGATEYALNTSNVAEGANLYYTDARARAAVSGSTTVTYSSGTGVFSLTSGNVTTALGFTPANSASLGTMSTQGAGAVAITGGTMTGVNPVTVSYTVATLPAGTQGMRAFVTDATAVIFASVPVGGGVNKAPVYHDGAGWLIG